LLQVLKLILSVNRVGAIAVWDTSDAFLGSLSSNFFLLLFDETIHGFLLLLLVILVRRFISIRDERLLWDSWRLQLVCIFSRVVAPGSLVIVIFLLLIFKVFLSVLLILILLALKGITPELLSNMCHNIVNVYATRSSCRVLELVAFLGPVESRLLVKHRGGLLRQILGLLMVSLI
jgi:hypothetical protein